MNTFYADNANKKIMSFGPKGLNSLICGLFAEHTIELAMVDDSLFFDELREVVENGTWGDLNDLIENNF